MTRRESRQHGAAAADRQESATFNDSTVRAGGRWRLRNWRLRSKLLAVLLIPVVTLVGLFGLRVRSDLAQADEYAATAARLTVGKELTELVRHLQGERSRSVRFVAGGRADGLADVRTARERVDEAAGELGRVLADERDRLSGAARSGFDRGRHLLDGITELRYSVTHAEAGTTDVFDDYSALLAGLLDVGDRAISETEDTALTRHHLAAAAMAKMTEQHSVINGLLAAALANGGLSEQRERAVLAAQARLAAAREDFRSFATARQGRVYDATVAGPQVEARRSMLSDVLATEGSSVPAGVDLARWNEAATRTTELLAAARDTLHAQLVDRAAALRGAARTALLVDLAVLFGVVLVGGALAVVVARSLLRPMRILRHSALDIAEDRLPSAVQRMLTDSQPWPDPGQEQRSLVPVPVFSREELGQIARAFDAVHREAVRMAGEQAMLRANINSMFVNLAQRSQDLVERQLSVLDRMEAHEQDSDTLGGLFELDHLATRMRRNSENLLVLSGQELDYPVAGAVTAEEAIGAALSEVEQYQRVRVRASPEPTVHSGLANDLVHVLSELLENATAYSPSTSEVLLVSTVSAGGGWRIEITDWGAGMADVELRRANQRLAEPPEVDVEVSRRMGLYVVARLSARHRIDVRLSEAATGGITATVDVPARLVTLVTPPGPSAATPEPDTAQLPRALQWPIAEPVAENPRAAVDDVPRASQEEQLADATEVSATVPAGDGAYPQDVAAPEEAEDAAVWPVEDNDPHPLELETPTERLPAYREVLAEWFQVGSDGKLDDLTGAVSRSAPGMDGDLEWPASVDSVWSGPRSDGGGAEALPKRVPRQDSVPAADDTPAMDEAVVAEPVESASEVTDEVPVEGIAAALDGLLPISRSPEDVRDRMAGLQSGLQRGRHERAESMFRDS